jgi:hypothetical protein
VIAQQDIKTQLLRKNLTTPISESDFVLHGWVLVSVEGSLSKKNLELFSHETLEEKILELYLFKLLGLFLA